MAVGVLIVVQPALGYASSPPRREWGAIPEIALTVILVALMLVVGGVTRLLGRRRPRMPAFGTGLLWSSFAGYIAALVIFNI
ncbi:hypothetical protein LG324_13510 [Phycicoccus jejuensis]|uniref:hypothetical protein n=1 Tax=Phycicoccus jejuensis TaxID=367299 RepID=UPI00384A5F15